MKAVFKQFIFDGVIWLVVDEKRIEPFENIKHLESEKARLEREYPICMIELKKFLEEGL